MTESVGRAIQRGFRCFEKKLMRMRCEVNELYFKDGWTKNKIAKRLGVSKRFVIRWTQSTDQEFSRDMRGWKKDKGRRWSLEDRGRIKAIHEDLIGDPDQYYWGASAIQQEWRKRYGAPVIPLRTIGQIMSDLGLSRPRRRGKNIGAARYLCYPEYTIYQGLGYRVLEADFIGKKFLTGRTAPINFLGFSFKKDPRLRHFIRVNGETSANLIKGCKYFFRRFEKPGAIKLDNAGPCIGGNSVKRSLSRTAVFLLQKEVIPIFSVPRRPFSQASIEGNNSVFSRKFWHSGKNFFPSLSVLDEKLDRFNEASEKYTGYQRPTDDLKPTRPFVPKIYFIRQVKEDERSSAFVHLLGEEIHLEQAYVNYFILAEWNLSTERLNLFLEKNQKAEQIHECKFEINYTRYKPGSIARFKKIKSLCNFNAVK
jgi:transposase